MRGAGAVWTAATLAMICASAPADAQTGRDLRLDRTVRRALVVGNDAYQSVRPLKNAANDAEDLGARLSELGFDVTVLLNADLRGLNEGVDRFVASLQPGDVALFHFSGHGLQHDHENFLVPVDFELTDAASLRYDAYSASKIQDRLAASGAALSLVLLDACRNNGFESSRGAGGLAAMNPAHGSFIAFATGPGAVADDNPSGRNGLFTSVLLDALEEPGLELVEVFGRVRQGVVDRSGGRQTPWTLSSVLGRFYFNDAGERVGSDPVRPETPRPVRREVSQAGPEPGEVRINPKDGAAYAWIPAGTFRMGCAEGDTECDGDERPARTVEISQGFWMARTETTVGRFKWARKSMSKPMPPPPGVVPNPIFILPPLHPGHNPGWQSEDHPMVMATWEEANWYCREAAGGRLPSEAEWERAARGGGDGVYWFGELTHDKANYGGDGACCTAHAEGRDEWLQTAPVASFEPNPYNLYDTAGNVWEWTSDWYDQDLHSTMAERDPGGPEEGKMRSVRGGCWDSIPKHVRPSDRHSVAPNSRTPYLGFRCVVLDLPKPAKN